MSFYLHQQPVEGDSYVRCHQVVIDNRMGAAPSVTFHRERVLTGGAAMRQPLSPTPMPFDPTAEIPLIDPETGQPTGETITHADIYAAVYSAFIAAETPAPAEGDAV